LKTASTALIGSHEIDMLSSGIFMLDDMATVRVEPFEIYETKKRSRQMNEMKLVHDGEIQVKALSSRPCLHIVKVLENRGNQDSCTVEIIA
jgi:hypothetical protein